ncbi:MAG: hypothetical protein IJ644_10590 [Oscillospiraceae bacterium]|nr:hypothetical protein [Oscillospiraceae bacterium]
MALRKKKNQQDDSEKLQELLKSWDIQLPEKEKKSDFPETSLNDFPQADFPEIKSENKFPQPETQIQADAVSLRKEPDTIQHEMTASEIIQEKTEQQKPAVSLKKQSDTLETEQKFQKLFQEYRNPKPDKTSGVHEFRFGNPELDKKFKQEAIQYMHGTVRLYSQELFIITALLVIFAFVVMHGIFICFSILALGAAAFLLWYASRWKLTFDGMTNRFSYESLTCPEICFHASEIESLRIEHGFRSPEEMIFLSVHGRKICIWLGFPQYILTGHQGDYLGGCYGAHKLREYLEFYRALHGEFSYSQFQTVQKKSESSSKEELMQMLAKYQKQIDDKNKE